MTAAALRRGAGALAVCLALWSGCPGAARAAEQEIVGEVVAVRGPVVVLRPGAGELIVVGTAVHRSDRIVTGADGRLKVRFADGTVVSLGPGSELVAAEFAVAADGTRIAGVLTMLEGLLRAVVAPGAAASRFELRMSTAVASVRSTDWMAEARATNSAVVVLDGTVAVAGRGAAADAVVLLAAGEGTDVPAGGPPSPPKRWGQGRIDSLASRTGLP